MKASNQNENVKSDFEEARMALKLFLKDEFVDGIFIYFKYIRYIF